ncbi:hypothetical protein M422DRAFT_24887 [Sphaerobolus stellatus SS14]|nr:hypothetical protein M422DRAFT_24887 [Sphaerobolus stellatus SS14]
MTLLYITSFIKWLNGGNRMLSATIPRYSLTCVSYASTMSIAMKHLTDYFLTLYLFTLSDIKTILIPVTFSAILASPNAVGSRIHHTVFWTWIHLLQFCVSNQSLDPAEDLLNKPWRPIPSGRMSVRHAKKLRILLVPICLAISIYYRALDSEIALALAFLAHNELGLHGHWAMRNICNAIGYTAFEWGATIVGCRGDCTTKSSGIPAQLIIALIIGTTIQAQDFRDVEGDLQLNRKTIPIVWPKLSRATMPLLLCGWSIYILASRQPHFALSLILMALASYTGCRFTFMKDAPSDRRSYLLYNIWLCFAHIILLS